MNNWVIYLVCFIIGWIIARMMGDGFNIGGENNCYLDNYKNTCNGARRSSMGNCFVCMD